MQRNNKLRKQLLLVFLVACIGILSAQAVIRLFWTLPTFEAMARQNDVMDIQQTESQLQQQIDGLSKMVYDSAAWDTMYEAIELNRTDWFNDDYVIADALQRLDINGWYLYNNLGERVGGGSFNNDYEPFSPEEFESSHLLQENDVLISLDEVKKNSSHNMSKVRFLTIDDSPVLSISYNVTKSKSTSDSMGTLLLWSYIDKQFIANLTPGMSDVIGFYDGEAAQALNKYLTKTFAETPEKIQPIEFNNKLYIGVDDKDNNLLFVLSIPIRERTYDRRLFDSSLITGLLISGSVLVFFYLFINYQLLRPLNKLLLTVSRAINTENFTTSADYRGENELHQLGRRVNELFLLIETQRQELLERNVNLEQISYTDSLTGLANRRALDIYLDKLGQATSAQNEPISIFIADVDYFKLYNDYYGHSQGDEALRLIAQIIIGAKRQVTDFVARYGGEEFVVVLRNTDHEQAFHVAENLRNALQNAAIEHQGRKDCSYVTVSVGVATKPAQQKLDYDLLFKAADDALYRAKSAGRNCTVVS